jgi:small-conductance mechanosensitive channel
MPALYPSFHRQDTSITVLAELRQPPTVRVPFQLIGHPYSGMQLLKISVLALFLCALQGAYVPAHAQAAAPQPGAATATAGTVQATAPGSTAGSTAITPTEARKAIDVLQDDAQRAQALKTLKTIAGAAPASDGSAASTAPTAAAVATPPAAAPAAAIVPLEANGLTARMMRSLEDWADNLGRQIKEFGQVVATIPSLFARSDQGFNSPAAQHLLGHLFLALLAAFVIGLALEWALQRLLLRPRRALVQHAEHVDAVNRTRDNARMASNALHAAQTARSAATAPAPPPGNTQTETSDADAGVRPVAEGMAMVQTSRDGVEVVEAVQVGKENAAAGPGAKAAQPERSDAANAAGPDAAMQPEDHEEQLRRSRNHWRTLRHIPYALGTLLIDLLPLALFFVAATLLLRWLAEGDVRVHTAASGFINAYVMTRFTMAVVRLLVSPVGHGLRVLYVSGEVSVILQIWVRRIAALALFGMALAEAGPALGTINPMREAFLKTASLLVHLSVSILLLRLRRPVGAVLRAKKDAVGPLAAARNWFAEVWAYLGVELVMGVWVVWALGVEDGLPKLIHFVVETACVIVGARILAIFTLGAVGRMFQNSKPSDNADPAAVPDTRASMQIRLSGRYFRLVRSIISFVIWACTIIVLLQMWGVDALGWFAVGTLGASLASAALTILVSIIIAIAVWEASQYAVELRLARWMRQGDVVRAARLRTLLPMLRTALFVVVVLVVGMTVLNQLGVNTTPMLAGASILGVALGFGSQKLVQDFITGIFLLMENAMRVGDWVTVAGVSGSVEYLSIRTVRLRGGDGSLYIVPFSSVSTVNNTNRGLGNAAVRISVSYDTDVEQVIQELKKIGTTLREDPAFRDVILNDIEVWGVDSVDGSMVTLAGQMRCSDKGRWGVQREINRRILERFRELGIEIANPRASLLMSSDSSVSTAHSPPVADEGGEAAMPPRRT